MKYSALFLIFALVFTAVAVMAVVSIKDPGTGAQPSTVTEGFLSSAATGSMNPRSEDYEAPAVRSTRPVQAQAPGLRAQTGDDNNGDDDADDDEEPETPVPTTRPPVTTVPPTLVPTPVPTVSPTPPPTLSATPVPTQTVVTVRTVYVYPSGPVYLPSYYYPPYYSYPVNGYTPTGSMTVTSYPSNAIVTLDGYNIQTTPWVYTNMLPGYHSIEINFPGYEPYVTNVFMEAGDSPVVHANLITRRSYGSLFIDSTPRGADVYVDGHFQGTSPLTVASVSQGPHRIELHLAGYEVLTRTVSVVSGQGNSMNLVLMPYSSSSQSGSIDITSTIPGALIYLDGTYLGSTTAGRTFNAVSVSPGPHTLLLHVPGYTDFIQTVQVGAGQVARVNAVFSLSSAGTAAPAGMLPGMTGAQSGGTIVVTSSPAGAEVYLDNQFRGVAPVTIYNVPPGNHILNLQLEGYAGWSGSTDVPAGQVVSVAASMTPGAGIPATPGASVPAMLVLGAIAGCSAAVIAHRRRI